jgi:hypothetical protein
MGRHLVKHVLEQLGDLGLQLALSTLEGGKDVGAGGL